MNLIKRIAKTLLVISLTLSALLLNGCMGEYADINEENYAKTFNIKNKNLSQIYIYRPDHLYGSWVKKRVWVDGDCVGEIVSGSFVVVTVNPGYHVVSTRSEFGNNHILVKTKKGHNYFVKQNIKYGVFSSGSGIRLMKPEYAKKVIKDLDLLIDANDKSYDIDKSEIEKVKRDLILEHSKKYPAK